MERDRMGLRHGGRVPGPGMVGRVGGVKGGGISPGVHESRVQEECAEPWIVGSIEDGLESSYMERFGAERKGIIRGCGKGNVSGTAGRGECATLLPPEQGGMENKKTGEPASARLQEPKAVSEAIDNDNLASRPVIGT
jgi:hypothetical protein